MRRVGKPQAVEPEKVVNAEKAEAAGKKKKAASK